MTESKKDYAHALAFLCRILGHNFDKYHATEHEKKIGRAKFICKRCGYRLISKIETRSDGTYKMDPNPTNIF